MSKQFINDAFMLDPENYPGGSRKSPRATAIPSGRQNISIMGLYNRSVKTIDSNLTKSKSSLE